MARMRHEISASKMPCTMRTPSAMGQQEAMLKTRAAHHSSTLYATTAIPMSTTEPKPDR